MDKVAIFFKKIWVLKSKFKSLEIKNIEPLLL